MGHIRPDSAELLITHKRSQKPARLQMFKENGTWKVGLVETFWTRKKQKDSSRTKKLSLARSPVSNGVSQARRVRRGKLCAAWPENTAHTPQSRSRFLTLTSGIERMPFFAARRSECRMILLFSKILRQSTLRAPCATPRASSSPAMAGRARDMPLPLFFCLKILKTLPLARSSLKLLSQARRVRRGKLCAAWPENTAHTPQS